MLAHVVAAIMGLSCITLVPVSAGPRIQQSKVFDASATVDVVGGPPLVILHLKNDSALALEAWVVRIDYDLPDGSHKTEDRAIDTSPDESEPGTPGRGSVLPAETRDVRLVLSEAAVKARVAIVMLLFEDGTVEGARDWAEGFFTVRERRAETFRIWIDALDAALRVPAPEARRALERTLASESRRMKETPGGSAALSAFEKATVLLQSPDSALLFDIADLKQRFERNRERALHGRARE